MSATLRGFLPKGLSALAAAPLLSLCLGSGLLEVGAGSAAAVTPVKHSPRIADPYAVPGLTVRLPGGGRVRLVWPEDTAGRTPGGATGGTGTGGSGAGPGAAPGPTPDPTVTASLSPPPPSPPVAPAPGVPAPSASAPPAGTSGSLPGFPVPVLGTLFAWLGPWAISPSASPSGAHASPGPSATQSSGRTPAPSPGRTSEPSPQRVWDPVGQGPPPLGPQALAAPVAGFDALAAARQQAPSPSHTTLKRRLLPLGAGLALMGCGAALFGWKLRRM